MTNQLTMTTRRTLIQKEYGWRKLVDGYGGRSGINDESLRLWNDAD